MEAVAPPYYAAAPHAQTAQLLDARTHPTRPIPAPDIHLATHNLTSTESSQDSLKSAQSATSSLATHSQIDGSDASQLTDYSDFARPISSSGDKTHLSQEYQPRKRATRRDQTPDEATPTGSYPCGADAAFASPMSLTSPIVSNGSKRTASGHVKQAASLPYNTYNAIPAAPRARGTSISSTNSRASELAATLKARLAYAAAKVQHGWEHKSLDEVERLAEQQVSAKRNSASYLDQRPGTSGLSNGTAKLSMYEPYAYASDDHLSSPPAKRYSATFTSSLPSTHSHSASLSSIPRLQPPADIVPNAHPRQVYTPPLRHKPTNSITSTAMSPPRTPLTQRPGQPPPPRAGMLWGEVATTEAERDALQALSQLGSPQAAHFFSSAGTRPQSLSQGSSNRTSPLRSELATPRRVTFARAESFESVGRRSSEQSSGSEGASV